MSSHERSGTRSLLYSGWHRHDKIRRYLEVRQAHQLTMIDVDAVEYCCVCRTPLALIETQIGDRPPKDASVTQRLAELAGLPAFSVSYIASEDGNDITAFRLRELHPNQGAEAVLSPGQYACWLWTLRTDHQRNNGTAACSHVIGKAA